MRRRLHSTHHGIVFLISVRKSDLVKVSSEPAKPVIVGEPINPTGFK